MVCKKGYKSFSDFLIPFYLKHNISIDSYDNKMDTPLLLACSHGYDEIINFNDPSLDQKQKDQLINDFLENKATIVKNLLKNGADIKRSVIDKKNNPLHWAIYYGDYETGITIFNEYPLIMLKTNENG